MLGTVPYTSRASINVNFVALSPLSSCAVTEAYTTDGLIGFTQRALFPRLVFKGEDVR